MQKLLLAAPKPQTDVINSNKQDAGEDTVTAEAAMTKEKAALEPEETLEAGTEPIQVVQQKDVPQLENSDFNSK